MRRVLLILAFLVISLPLAWAIFSSLRPSAAILVSPFGFEGFPTFGNFGTAWGEANFSRYFVNSLTITTLTLAILMPIGSMAAYVLAQFRSTLTVILQGFFALGMMFPTILSVVPLYLLLASWGLVNTLPGIVLVYVAYSLSFTIFVLVGFFQVLPKELAEAATIDGASDGQTFFRVMLPIARPGVVVVAILNGIGIWNEYNLAKILLRDDQQTLPLGLANLTVGQFYKADFGALFAGLTLAVVPVLLVYWIFKGKIQEAMLAGALK